MPVIVITSKDLTDADHQQLNGHVNQVLQKGAYSQAELIAEIRRLVAGRQSGT